MWVCFPKMGLCGQDSLKPAGHTRSGQGLERSHKVTGFPGVWGGEVPAGRAGVSELQAGPGAGQGPLCQVSG